MLVSEKRRSSRPVRLSRLAREYARHYEKMGYSSVNRPQKSKARSPKKPFRRKAVTRSRVKPIIAYDLETTRIKANESPTPKYITWYGESTQGSIRCDSLKELGEIIVNRLLVPEFNGFRFVAWNGNNFDVYLVAAALLAFPDFVLRPYLTRSKNLRGLRVTLPSIERDARTGKLKKLSWEFLDGISMTGLTGTPLKKFLERFAPVYEKLAGPDFEREEFDANNTDHVKYAERDSEGLYFGMVNAQNIVLDSFGVPLFPTIGNTGIRIFQHNIPESVVIWSPPYSALSVIRDVVMRGGFCFCVRKFKGPVWKYDINQAYAAAMRDCYLPAGRCIHTDRVHKYANAAIYRINATIDRAHAGSRIPFYYRDADTEKGLAAFGLGKIDDTWVTNEELQQLQREKWKINVIEGWFWDEVFTMKEYVNKLEHQRMNAEGGPSGAKGLMIKAIGNNSYGKTVEKLDGLELVLAKDMPEGFSAYQDDPDDLFQHVWAKLSIPVPREYHQPQIGAFITAHVRMVLRRAILLDPDAWLYADTDCVIFSRPMEGLNIDPGRYGFWKDETEDKVNGDPYFIINKKVYASVASVTDEKTVNGNKLVRPKVAHSKGLNVKLLSSKQFEDWYNGSPPEQTQVQRQNFIKVMSGFDMFAERVKVGERL